MSDTADSENSFPLQEYSFPPPGRLEGDWRKWGFGHVIVGFIASFFAAALAFNLVKLANRQDIDDLYELPMWGISVVTLSQQLVLIAIVIIAARFFGESLRKDFLLQARPSDSFKGLSLGIAAQFILVPATTYPFIWLFNIDPDRISEPAKELSDKATSPLGVGALVLTVVVLAPVSEELFYRGLLYGAIRKRFKVAQSEALTGWFPIIVSSLIFSAVHFQLLLFPALFFVGVTFALIYEKSQRLAPAIWAHVGFNATTLFNLLVIQ